MLVTIDSPGFTYRVAKRVRKLRPELKIIHIVAPSVWAYKPNRALQYAKIYNHLLALLPFEPPYFTRVGLPCTYIGHPVMEQQFIPKASKVDGNLVVCVTAGSRIGEIKRHLPIFKEALELVAESAPKMEVVFVLANREHEPLMVSILEGSKFSYRFSLERLASFAEADIALAKSGTNTLEIAASGTPLVVAYKLNILSFWLLKLFIKIKYASLINIIAGQEIIPELIQDKCTAQNIAEKLLALILNRGKMQEQVEQNKLALQKMQSESGEKPSLLAAKVIMNMLQQKIKED